MRRTYPAALILLVLLAACGKGETPDTDKPDRDPAVSQALNDPIMVDPDLSQRNEGAAAVTIDTDHSLPIIPVTPEAIAAAREDAIQMLDGKVLAVPAASGTVAAVPTDARASGNLATLPGAAECKAKLARGAIWAARLPPELPVYPRGATQAAAGGDSADCHARVVRFTTPVPVADVLSFYWTRATQSKYAPRHRKTDGGQDVLDGRRGNDAFDLRVKAGKTTHQPTEVVLATIARD
ncbi:hypothetical protein [Tsuneonella mangrovi]|uniref:hypothetical protein n=1 Tax=Tsuneonella mangrovi TaxID=1982042 RepID=UPI000BA23C14|nr:hypothetical protein [Tsuneonella mangrovi]